MEPFCDSVCGVTEGLLSQVQVPPPKGILIGAEDPAGMNSPYEMFHSKNRNYRS